MIAIYIFAKYIKTFANTLTEFLKMNVFNAFLPSAVVC